MATEKILGGYVAEVRSVGGKAPNLTWVTVDDATGTILGRYKTKNEVIGAAEKIINPLKCLPMTSTNNYEPTPAALDSKKTNRYMGAYTIY